MNAKTAAFLRALPKTEAHLHIEGALPLSCLRLLGGGADVCVPSRADDYRFASFGDFDGALLGLVCPWYNSPERYHAAARKIFADLRAQNVRYVETSFASGVLQFTGIDGAAVAEAIRKAAPADMCVRVFLGIHHDGCPPKMERVLADALGWRYLDGVDLHGDETVPLESWTPAYYAAARAAGKRTKAHAGEFCGPAFIREALEKLGVRQLEHGVRAVEDATLVRALAQTGVQLDVCPTSNVKLGVVASYATHPLRALRAAGVRCTLASDDPLIFGPDLSQEYENAREKMGFSLAELCDIAADGWRGADVDARTRAEMLAQIDCQKRGLCL